MTPEQLRAGRALARLSQEDLARLSGLSVRTIIAFENGDRVPYLKTWTALRDALEDAGVMLIDENGGGRGVRLIAPSISNE